MSEPYNIQLTPGNEYVFSLPHSNDKIIISCPIETPPFAVVIKGEGKKAELHQFEFAKETGEEGQV